MTIESVCTNCLDNCNCDTCGSYLTEVLANMLSIENDFAQKALYDERFN